MTDTNKLRWLQDLCFFVALVTAGSPCATAAQITFDPQSKGGSVSDVLKVGDSFVLQLIGKDFEKATIGGGVDIGFNPAVLRLDRVAFESSVFDFQKQVNGIDNASGRVDSILVSSVIGEHSGRFQIAELSFTAIGGGLSSLDLSASTFPAPWLNVDAEDLNPSLVSGSVKVVPLPLPIALLASGVGLLGLFRRKSQP